MNWQLVDTVYTRPGTVNSGNIAAFDFDNTLAWSDSGLIFMRTANDWVPTVASVDLISFLQSLTKDAWTIVIFTNQLQNDPEFTRKSLERIDNFILQLQGQVENFHPHVYVSIANDGYRKPARGMWVMFARTLPLAISTASFYCGDAAGATHQNPLYWWADFDSAFARNTGLTFYTPDELFGSFTNHYELDNYHVLLLMAAHESQYDRFIQDNPKFTRVMLDQAANVLRRGYKVIVAGERFATLAGRRRAMHLIPKEYHPQTAFLMFTQPIKPFVTDQGYRDADNAIRGYANALDVHPNLRDIIMPAGQEPFPIIRMN